MPVSAAELFSSVGLELTGSSQWGDLPDSKKPGIYALSLCSDPRCNGNLLPSAPINVAMVAAWIERVPSFLFKNTVQPDPHDVVDFLRNFWMDDESIIYIGKATCLRNRLMQYRGHKLGNRSPHAGGHWVKILSNLDEIYMHYCEVETVAIAETKEQQALSYFKSQANVVHSARIGNTIPFANREHPRRNLKQNSIRFDVLA